MTNRRVIAAGVMTGLIGVGGLVAVNQPEPVSDHTGGVLTAAVAPNGDVLRTHGADALPPPRGAPRVAPEVAWPCVGTGTDGYRVQWVYAHGPGVSTLEALRPTLEAYARRVQGTFAASSNGQRFVRFVTDDECSLSILDVTVSQAGLDDFDRFIADLQAQGLSGRDRVYAAWVEASAYCGIGTVGGDDRPTPDNPANRGPEYGRSDRGCWNYAEAHELLHNLGAVQLSAPNSSGGWHCNDEGDVMCYADGGPTSQIVRSCPGASADDRLDCGSNDYFAVPEAGVASGYLANHWNVADSLFLAAGATPTTSPPTTTAPPTTTPPSTTSTSVGKGKTRTDLTFAPDRLRVGQPFEARASVVGQTGACGWIGDSAVVEFLLSGKLVERRVASAGVATLTLTIREPARYTIRARYLGDDRCAPSQDSARKRIS